MKKLLLRKAIAVIGSDVTCDLKHPEKYPAALHALPVAPAIFAKLLCGFLLDNRECFVRRGQHDLYQVQK